MSPDRVAVPMRRGWILVFRVLGAPGSSVQRVAGVPVLLLRLFGLLCLVTCTSGDSQKDTSSAASETETTGEANPDDGGPEDEGPNTDHFMEIKARVQVELYTTNEAGGREFLSWDDAVGPVGEFPFGSVFVAAYRPDDEGREDYFDQHTVTRPRVTGDMYKLDIDPEAVDAVNIYATLDVRGDGVVGSNEPMGIHPDPIPVEAYGSLTDANVVILVDWDRWGPGGWGWQDVGGYTPPVDTDGDGIPDAVPPGGCDLVAIAGDVEITVPYEGGNGMVMLLDNAGGGPYQQKEFTPIPTGSGATAEYNMGVCVNAGPMQIVAAYDSNGNGLVDPADLWGAYISEPGQNGNPLVIEDYRREDVHVEIPIGGGGPAVSVVPFVRLSGIAYPEAVPRFSDLATDGGEGLALHVVALKYPPTPDFNVSAFEEDAYDAKVWDSDTLGDEESVDWDLVVPANTIVYLLAFVDADGDGLVNEEREPVAYGGVGGAAALSTGDEGHAGIGLRLRVVED